MKRFILIFVSLILALNGNANAENITINCELKKFFTKKNYVSEKIQIKQKILNPKKECKVTTSRNILTTQY